MTKHRIRNTQYDDERGQALVIALLALALGTLLVAGFLYFASTSQRATRAAREQAVDHYSADAGVEHALWRIGHQDPFRQSLLSGTQSYTQTINDAAVAISVTQTVTGPGGGSGGGGGSGPPLYDVRVEPDQSSFVLPNGSSHTYELSVVNAGRVADQFETSMELHFDTQSGNTRWWVEVSDADGNVVYQLNNYRPAKGSETLSTGVFDTTPMLNPGISESYAVTVTKGTQGGQNNNLDIEFVACSVGAANESPPETICDTSWLYTSVESNNTPAIGMSKVATPFTVSPGDQIVYTVTCENAGDGDADTVTVVDTLPDETEARFVVGSANVSEGTIAYSNDEGATWGYTPAPDADGLDGAVDAISWALINVVAGDSHDLTFSVQVNDPYTSAATLVHNEAEATWEDGPKQYGPTSTSFNNPVIVHPVYRVIAAVDGTTITAYVEWQIGNTRILSWEINP